MEGKWQRQQRPSVLRQVFQTPSRQKNGMQTIQCTKLHTSNIIFLHPTYCICADFCRCASFYMFSNENKVLKQWFLTLLEVLNPASFISAFTEPFVIGKIKYDFFKTYFLCSFIHVNPYCTYSSNDFFCST